MTLIETHHRTGPLEQTLAFAVILLFFISTYLGNMFFQLRGVPPGQFMVTVGGYLAGIASGALFMDVLMREISHLMPARRRALVFAMALPALFSLAYFPLTPPSGAPLGNFIASFLWSALLPMSLYVFFQHATVARQALYLGIAMGAGHLCWSLVAPAVGSLDPASSDLPLLKERALAFLNVTRCLACLAVAALVWRLSANKDAACGQNTAGQMEQSGKRALRIPGRLRRIALLMLPVVLCGALNGLMGYLFLLRLFARDSHIEYAHLVMVLLFPLLGAAVARRGGLISWFFPAGAVLCYVASPLIFMPTAPGWLVHSILLACAVGQQVLFFAAMLALARFLPQSRCPALLLSLPWFVYLLCTTVCSVAAANVPFIGQHLSGMACALAALCAASAFALRRCFPLPEPQVAQSEAPDALAEYLARVKSENAMKIAALTVAFDLQAREVQVLESIVGEISPEQLSKELGISEKTVRYHQTGLFRKTGHSSRRQLLGFFRTWEP